MHFLFQKKVEVLVSKWQQYYNEENTDGNANNDSSDDEPIQKYKNYDSGIELCDDIKHTIRTEVARVLKLQPDSENKKLIKPTAQPQKRPSEADKPPKKQKSSQYLSPFSSAPEVAFADVNEVHSVGLSKQMFVKTEIPCTFPSNIEGNKYIHSFILHLFIRHQHYPEKTCGYTHVVPRQKVAFMLFQVYGICLFQGSSKLNHKLTNFCIYNIITIIYTVFTL